MALIYTTLTFIHILILFTCQHNNIKRSHHKVLFKASLQMIPSQATTVNKKWLSTSNSQKKSISIVAKTAQATFFVAPVFFHFNP